LGAVGTPPSPLVMGSPRLPTAVAAASSAATIRDRGGSKRA
jgi:hypothetical protein